MGSGRTGSRPDVIRACDPGAIGDGGFISAGRLRGRLRKSRYGRRHPLRLWRAGMGSMPIRSFHWRKLLREGLLPAPPSLHECSAYRTAIVAVLEVTPPIVIVTGTALPFAEPAGTCTFTW